jgi:tetratricopeptide (TPR) repeat protein
MQIEFHRVWWLLCVMLLAPSSWAQDASSALPTEPATEPAVTTSAPVPPDVVEEARRRFDRGLSLYTEGDFTLALIEFERAYELVSNYRVLYNIGQVSIQLRQYARARQALEQYLSEGEGEIDANRLEEVRADLEMLKPRTAKLTVTVNVASARVFLDGKLLGMSPLPEAILVDAGGHVLEIERAGYLSTRKPVTLAGGDDLKIAVSLEEVAPERTVEKTIVVQNKTDSSSTWKWIGWGTAGLFAAGAVTTGVFGLNAASDLEDQRNTAGTSREALDSSQSRARRMFMASDILAVGALAAAGVSLYLTFGSDDAQEPSPVTAKVGIGPASVSVSGAF